METLEEIFSAYPELLEAFRNLKEFEKRELAKEIKEEFQSAYESDKD